MRNNSVIKYLWLFLSLIYFIILFLLLKQTFFFHDEWSFLYKVITDPLGFVLESHNGHFMPLFGLSYLILYKVFRLNYAPYELFLLIFHFLNAYLLSLIVIKITKKKYLGFLSFVLFLASSSYWEVLFSFSTFPTVLCLTMMALSIYYYLLFSESESQKDLFLSGLFSFFFKPFLGSGIIFSFFIHNSVFWKVDTKDKKKNI